MDSSEFRVEHDSMGDVRVPAKAYYGAQTQRAVENFPISGWPLPAELIPRRSPTAICENSRAASGR
jgi:fumarate hydratase class II